MSFKHGLYISEQATSIVSPVESSAGLTVALGTAPINLGDTSNVNKVNIFYTYAEAVAAMGFSFDFDKFTLCEVIYSHFAKYNQAPLVLINVLDPSTHKASVSAATALLSSGSVTLADIGILLASLVVKSSDGATTFVSGTDYAAAFDDDGKLVITRISGGAITSASAELKVSYDKLDPSAVDADDIIGGVDTDGSLKGLELINQVFPKVSLVPGIIIAPKFSTAAAVASAMSAKASSINGLFKAIVLTDIPTGTVTKYSDCAEWKNNNSMVNENQVLCWPKIKSGDYVFHASTHLASIMCRTDVNNDDIPYVSPSNKTMSMDSAVLEDGTEVWLGLAEANYLNGIGVFTALNFQGWSSWGNYTAIYPKSTDVKDCFIPVRRMFNWVGNTILLSFWSKVDGPLNKRFVETFTESINIWLNGLTAQQALLGGRLEFIESENPTTSLLAGKVKFHLYLASPVPGQEVNVVLEYDPDYLSTLFS